MRALYTLYYVEKGHLVRSTGDLMKFVTCIWTGVSVVRFYIFILLTKDYNNY